MKTWILRGLAVCLSSAAVLIVVEIGLRLMPRTPPPINAGIDRVWSESDPAPGFVAAKPEGSLRVVVVGDSFTWGWGVYADDAYPERLGRRLAAWRPDAHIEVINEGHVGWNTVDEWSALNSAYAEEADPDFVILGYVLNDPEPGSWQERRAMWAPLQPRPPAEGAGSRLYGSSALARLVYDCLEQTRRHREERLYYARLFDEQGEYWQRCAGALRELRDELGARSIGFVVVVFPVFESPLDESYPYRAYHRQVMETCRTLNIQAIDLMDNFIGVDWHAVTVAPNIDSHPNELGHRIATDAIFLWLQRFETFMSLVAEHAGEDPAAP